MNFTFPPTQHPISFETKSPKAPITLFPHRKFVLSSPDVAEMVFNRCIKDNGRHLEDPLYEITLDFEFFEDIYVDWSDFGDGTASETSSQLSFAMEEGPRGDDFQKIRGETENEDAVRQLEEKSNHPLMIMVRTLLRLPYHLSTSFLRLSHPPIQQASPQQVDVATENKSLNVSRVRLPLPTPLENEFGVLTTILSPRSQGGSSSRPMNLHGAGRGETLATRLQSCNNFILLRWYFI